jgi:hypothetical protein
MKGKIAGTVDKKDFSTGLVSEYAIEEPRYECKTIHTKIRKITDTLGIRVY